MAKVHLGRLRSGKDPRIVSSLKFMMLRAKRGAGAIDSATLDEIYRVSRPTWPSSPPGQPRWWYEPPEPADGTPTQAGE
jgi:hypothetical protein